MKTILFLHDTSLTTPRGAELTIKELILLGEKKGYTVQLDYLNDLSESKKRISNADLCVVNSTSRCRYELPLLEFLLEATTPYIKLEYDYNFCIRRNILCTVDRNVRRCCNPDKFHVYRRLFGNAALNVFQSPKHYQAHYDFYGEAIAQHLIMPPTVTTSLLQPSEEKEDKVIPFFGDLNFLKGGHEYVTYAETHPDTQFKVYGRQRLRREMPSNISFHDPIPNEEVLKILGKTKQFICKPVWPEPSGRLAAEAFLSGCEMIANDRVGTFSFDFYPDDPKGAITAMEAAPHEFWQGVENILSEVIPKKAAKLKKVLVYKSYGGLGDIFFAIPGIYKLAEVSEELHFAVAPRLVDFFSKYLSIPVVNEEVVRQQESDYDHIYELGNYPAFRGYDLPHALKYPTHKKVNQHAIQHYIDTLSKLHPDMDNQLVRYPYFKTTSKSENPYFVVHHGAGFLLKIWPTEKYAQLVEQLLDQYPNLHCKIIKGPDDPDIEAHFTKKWSRVTMITGGMLDVGEAMAGALFHIGNDAGITHVAGGFNVPSVGIYGPTGPGSWGSFAEHNELIWGKKGTCNIRCNYDVILNCEHKICLNSITVARVKEAVYKVLSKAYPEISDTIVANPQVTTEFTKKDCLLRLGDQELLLEYHNEQMRDDIENLLQNRIAEVSNSADIHSVIDVLLQQGVLYEIPSFKK
ncbi:glycosyltransferase family 9 protein [Altibacter sp. HG106]|uniref:glycosyltransferase family 9 protein n=1 Tax=Altibacter sp. HG106 TaxID=3023937 RepID=UPI0023501E03|nr:glycosyltransferase family 9 protein [Altibacter sp. HG106]MDC7994051.1 glycosyltransferase family 9 protein [Altibacter sp. HG106]